MKYYMKNTHTLPNFVCNFKNVIKLTYGYYEDKMILEERKLDLQKNKTTKQG
jgi:hypothetical protein